MLISQSCSNLAKWCVKNKFCQLVTVSGSLQRRSSHVTFSNIEALPDIIDEGLNNGKAKVAR